MGKIWLTFFLIAAGIGIALASGYRFHAENLPYYLKLESGGQKQQITFRDGKTLTGVVVEETADKMKVDSDGAAMVFSRAEIESVQSAKGSNPWTLFVENYKKNRAKHPLVTHDKAQSLGAKVDYMILEPSRIADEIRSKHPEITSAGQQAAAMEGLRAAQAQARAVQAKAMAEMKKAED